MADCPGWQRLRAWRYGLPARMPRICSSRVFRPRRRLHFAGRLQGQMRQVRQLAGHVPFEDLSLLVVEQLGVVRRGADEFVVEVREGLLILPLAEDAVDVVAEFVAGGALDRPFRPQDTRRAPGSSRPRGTPPAASWCRRRRYCRGLCSPSMWSTRRPVKTPARTSSRILPCTLLKHTAGLPCAAR